jgi:hypothetical protein
MKNQFRITLPLVTFIISWGLFTTTLAQNKVGIGTSTPLELLDVNGDINLRGKIKLNSAQGEPGNVLSVGQDGNPYWVQGQEFTTFMRSYSNTTTVNIPVSAKKVMIEAWGGGGGGAQGGGGASGHYAMGIFNISAATSLSITIGTAGEGAETYTGTGTTGGSTIVTGGAGISVTAGGGRGATQYYGGLLPNNGSLASTVSGSALLRAVVINGENGQPTTQATYQVNSTTWHTHVQFGRGGHPPMGIGQGGHGSFRIHNAAFQPDGTSIKLYQGGYAGIAGGGGGGQMLGSGWGWAGGRGYVIVRY